MKKTKLIATTLLASMALVTGCAKNCEHVDENKDHVCDSCGLVLGECADANKDHLCDTCGAKLSEHEDANKDHKCDYCNAEMSQHADANKDHNCDYCNAKMSEHADENKDHKCDYCDAEMSQHADANKDHKCDYCNATMSEHADENKDHKCDYCNAEMSQHADANKDHNCDYCGQKMSDHADEDKNHKCDYCNATMSDHVDEDKDHNCDYCGQKMSEHADANKDHNCDYCGTKMSEHADENKDHNCDYCGAKMSEHADENKDHNCDYCGEAITQHVDEDKNHNCDICSEKMSDHIDEDNNHVCDYCDADLPWVEKITVTGISETMDLSSSPTATLKVTVTVHNGASNQYQVTISDTTVASYNSNKKTVTALKTGTFKLTVTSTFDENVKYEINVTVTDNGFLPALLNNGYTFTRSWPEETFRAYLGEGDYDLYEPMAQLMSPGIYYSISQNGILVVFGYNYTSGNNNALLSDIYGTCEILTDYMNEMYIAVDSTYTYTIIPTGLQYNSNGSAVIAIRIYKSSDIFSGSNNKTEQTNWTDEDMQIFQAEFPNIVEVPFFTLGEDYELLSLDDGVYAVYDNSANYNIIYDFEDYIADEENGWVLDEELGYQKEVNGFLFTVFFDTFAMEFGNTIQFSIEELPLKEFPEDMLDETIGDASDCEVPIPEGTGFEVETGVEDGQVKYMDILVYGGSFEDYVASFDDNDWYITQDDEEYYTINSLDYAVQIEVIGGSEDGSYMIFVMVGMPPQYTEWPSEAVAAFLNNRTTEVVPAANGTGYYTQLTNEGNVLEVTVVGGDKAEYLAALAEQGWSDQGSGKFLSSNESINVTVDDAYGENQFVVYVVFAGNEVSRAFPTEEVTAVLGEVAQDAVFGPEGSKFKSEVIENTQNAIFVKAYCTADNYADYIDALEEASWTVTEDLYGFTAVSPTKTVTIYATDYTDYSTPYITLEFIAKEVAQGNAEFPAETIASYIGEGKEYPIPEGDSYAGEDYGGFEYDITITGGDREAYIAALLEAGFTYDDSMSYEPEYAAYKSADETFYVYVYGSESNTDYMIGFGEAFSF